MSIENYNFRKVGKLFARVYVSSARQEGTTGDNSTTQLWANGVLLDDLDLGAATVVSPADVTHDVEVVELEL